MTPEQIERLREWVKENCSFDMANELFLILSALSGVLNTDLSMRFFQAERKIGVYLNGELISEVEGV